mmetsp:Transcript_6428/g.26047  ORF Transcript_6428/g.26047 Transcript_6428/m.26047 type:complete len:236 (+) Transcript_6428:1982-2689(+)
MQSCYDECRALMPPQLGELGTLSSDLVGFAIMSLQQEDPQPTHCLAVAETRDQGGGHCLQRAEDQRDSPSGERGARDGHGLAMARRPLAHDVASAQRGAERFPLLRPELEARGGSVASGGEKGHRLIQAALHRSLAGMTVAVHAAHPVGQLSVAQGSPKRLRPFAGLDERIELPAPLPELPLRLSECGIAWCRLVYRGGCILQPLAAAVLPHFLRALERAKKNHGFREHATAAAL